jgi:hypothetical protein
MMCLLRVVVYSSTVMAVLVTAIHVLLLHKKDVDARNKSGHDDII